MSDKKAKTITGIILGKNKINVLFKDSKLSISHSSYAEFNLYIGKKLTQEDIKKIKLYDNFDKYFSYAAKELSKNSLSEFELKGKLIKKGAKRAVIAQVIGTLRKYSLIDDKTLENDILELSNAKHYGFKKIKQLLDSKGIKNDYRYSFSRDFENALQLKNRLEIKFKKYNTKDKKNKIYAFYQRLGYTDEVINNILNDVEPTDKETENILLSKDFTTIKSRYIRKYKGKDLDDKIINALIRKGYLYEDILKIKGDNTNYEMD